MNRRKYGFVLFLFALGLFLLLAAHGLGEVTDYGRYSSCLASSSQLDALQAARAPAEQPLLTALSFDGQELAEAADTATLYYSLVEGSSTAYDPSITFSAHDSSVRLAIEDIALSDEVIAQNRSIRLVAYTDTEYATYQLVCTTLPLLCISTTDATDITRETSTMQFTLFDNRAQATQRVVSSPGEVHVRGAYTSTYPKQGYKITLLRTPGKGKREYSASLLGMRKGSDWVLYAAYNDQEKVRTVFSSRLWYDSCADDNPTGLTLGMKYEYVELLVNGQYWGLYALGFPIDEQQAELGENEFVYQKKDWLPMLQADLDNPDLWSSYFEVTQKSGSAAQDVWAPLRQYYSYLRDAQGTSTPFPSFMDWDNSLDMYLFTILVQAVDLVSENDSKNLKMIYKNVGSQSVLLYAPWDLDHTWGNYWEEPISYHFTPDFTQLMGLSPLYHLLQADDTETKTRLAQKYATLRAGAWSEDTIMALLDEYEADIFASGAYARDRARWPDGTYLEDDSVGLDLFRAYVRERLVYMDQYVAQTTQ
jgi:hypothetical protein